MHFNTIPLVFKKAWFLMAENAALVVRLAVVGWGLSFISFYINALRFGADYPISFLYLSTSFAIGILTILFNIGLLKSFINLYDKKRVEMVEVLSHQHLFIRFFLVTVFVGLLSFIFTKLLAGFLVFLAILFQSKALMILSFFSALPVLYFLVVFGFAYCVIVDKHLGAFQALKESARLSKGNRFFILFVYVLLLIFNAIVLRLIPLGLGSFISAPLSIFVIVVLYRKL